MERPQNEYPASAKHLLSSLRSTMTRDSPTDVEIPHRGALRRIEDETSTSYEIEIAVESDRHHVLEYTKRYFDFALRIFAILDAENRGLVDRNTVKEFATLRCPVFWRRDDDLRRLNGSHEPSTTTTPYDSDSKSPTFDEVWKSVAYCSIKQQELLDDNESSSDPPVLDQWELGVEGWMVFCRFIALAQYLEAKRRFSARHLQQTMRHRNSPRGSEVVMVEVPPPESPAPLSPLQLAKYEEKIKGPLPPPELDLDHSFIAAHDSIRRHVARGNQGAAKINLFGSSFSSSLLPSGSTQPMGSSNLEFAVTYIRRDIMDSSEPKEQLVVRRSMADMKWLDDTFTSHKALGGTLCGRILPPFPGSGSGILSSHFQNDESTSITTAGGAMAVAAASAGVGLIKDVAKSVFGTYLKTSVSGSNAGFEESSSNSSARNNKFSKRRNVNFALPESYYNPNSPAGKARQLERYLNYLLEHPALSTSFPLNTILKASQSGIEAAKDSLIECSLIAKELKDETPQLDDGKVRLASNFKWVRTAAQAAMALKVHGMLETTGMPSASARLQHASLPSFESSPHNHDWEDDEAESRERAMVREAGGETTSDATGGKEFEKGVVRVTSELQSDDQHMQDDDGYDLLPLPVPAPERRILSAGSDAHSSSQQQLRENRFHYGTTASQERYALEEEEESRSAFLGDISVDENIDKLREVIGSVDNTLARCLASSGGIGKARRGRQALQLDIVRGLDDWKGMRGRFVSQRSLLKGVAGIEQSKELYEESDLALIDDISWQASLASSAVTAAEGVRSAVRVSRTAANAKAAARSAAFSAQTACDTGKFSSIEEACAAQTRASIAQSHAIHAAVVDHEAKTVKRRATLALAHDVKCWNVHRKREMLKSCIAYARSQHEATRRAVDGWSSLRDGFIGTTMIPSVQERRSAPPPLVPRGIDLSMSDHEEVSATIFEPSESSDSGGQPQIVAVEHNALSMDNPSFESDDVVNSVSNATVADKLEPESNLFKFCDDGEPECILPFATAAPTPEEETPSPEEAKEKIEHANNLEEKVSPSSGSIHESSCQEQRKNAEDVLSASMQSLVDGLMSWGGGFDAEEDHFALPVGMAASIALEESSSAFGTTAAI